jgi:hypothetical protein
VKTAALLLTGAGAALALSQAGAAAAPAHPRPLRAEEAREIQSVVAAVAHHVDARRWTDLRAQFAAEVETDYTSLFGGAVQRQPGDGLIATWQKVFVGVATQHLLGPIDVAAGGKDGQAVARCHVRALHQARGAPGGELWEVLGHYQFELQRSTGGWKIHKLTLQLLIQTGNTKLLAEAAKRPR